MTQKQALQDLLAKIEAGDIHDTGSDVFKAIPKRGGGVYSDPNWYDAQAAYWRGSLDAAKALHEAVLPGWEYGLTNNSERPNGPCAFVAEWGNEKNGFESRSATPARAWLICIVKALIAEAEHKTP